MLTAQQPRATLLAAYSSMITSFVTSLLAFTAFACSFAIQTSTSKDFKASLHTFASVVTFSSFTFSTFGFAKKPVG